MHIISLQNIEKEENYINKIENDSYKTFILKNKADESPKSKEIINLNENKENLSYKSNILIKSKFSNNSSFSYSNDKFKLISFKNFFSSAKSQIKQDNSKNLVYY